MNALPIAFDRKGWRYNQIFRRGDLAIYRRKFIAGRSENCEVIRIGRHHGKIIAGRVVESAEVYPSSEQWGRKGWTLPTEQASLAKLEALEAAERQVT